MIRAQVTALFFVCFSWSILVSASADHELAHHAVSFNKINHKRSPVAGFRPIPAPGGLLWQFTRSGEVINSPALNPSGEIVVTSYLTNASPESGTNGWLRVLSADGDLRWERPLPG
ncbi:MAG TPA: hypothetical protein DCE44_01520, partial [Verrucomicrobiales bacterium]|nr:hypothetical protein [Verrucomicrobiales bacterium]